MPAQRNVELKACGDELANVLERRRRISEGLGIKEDGLSKKTGAAPPPRAARSDGRAPLSPDWEAEVASCCEGASVHGMPAESESTDRYGMLLQFDPRREDWEVDLDWADIFWWCKLLKTLSTIHANTHMTTGHYDGIAVFREANCALFL